MTRMRLRCPDGFSSSKVLKGQRRCANASSAESVNPILSSEPLVCAKVGVLKVTPGDGVLGGGNGRNNVLQAAAAGDVVPR